MNLVSFLIGAIGGIIASAGIIFVTELVRAYRNSTHSDPWNEYFCEEKPEQEFDWLKWHEADELNSERRAKQEFYDREEVENNSQDENL